jgi:outer membrane PBP1 activator LpoA protein
MWCKYVRVLLLASVLGGLCSCAQVNTTASPWPVAAPVKPEPPPAQTAQQDVPAPVEPEKVPVPSVLAVPLPTFKPMPSRIALLLPLRSESLGRVANVVRAGFMAAYETEKEQDLSITIVETSEAVQDVLSGYNTAALSHDIVVGPLSRTGVTALMQGGAVSKPTIALGQPDMPGDIEVMLPKNMLAIGLSIEDEARQVATWAHTDKPGAKVFAISTNIAWQRRASRAFGTQWKRLGGQLETLELGSAGGFLNPNGLLQLRKRIEAEKPEFLFVALDAALTRQVREAIGAETMIYGTSQLNPYALPDWVTAERMPFMNDVRLVDIPWQLQAEHPAVMVYPRLAIGPDQRRSADMERLYALGIDAYRVAREIAMNRSLFELDGVTGKLQVDFGGMPTRFQRTEVPAIYQDGLVVPLPKL